MKLREQEREEKSNGTESNLNMKKQHVCVTFNHTSILHTISKYRPDFNDAT